MWIVNNRKIFYGLSIILVLLSVASLIAWKLNPGIDFTGGTLIDVVYPNGLPDQAQLTQALSSTDPNVSVRASGSNEYIVRMKPISQDEHEAVTKSLSLNGTAQAVEKTFDSVGPVLGSEALRSAYVSIGLVIIGIVLYITFAFRKVSEPVSSWKYGLVAIVALAHDVIIPLGAFSILGHFAGYEVDTLFVTAILVVLGFSVHNTIVVFDRVRENLKLSNGKKPFLQIVGESVSQTLTRSINTSLTTLIALIVLYFVGGASTQHFSLALIIGIAAGTYSSVCIGSPLLVTLERWQASRKK